MCSQNCTLFDHTRYLRMGRKSFKLWSGRANPIATCVENLVSANPPVILIEFEPHKQPVKFLERECPKVASYVPAPDTIRTLDDIISKDPLTPLTAEEKKRLHNSRVFLKDNAAALPKVLLSVAWDDPEQVADIHKLLESWVTLSPMQALALLDAQYADPQVRAFAVKCLRNLTDGECSTILLQLTQVSYVC